MGYRIEYASSARAGCKGPKPCSSSGVKIAKGELRFGTVVTIKEHQTLSWRHFGCITPKIFDNIKKDFPTASEVEGFDDLREEDREKFSAAYEVGHVADEDIPESARKKIELDSDGEPIVKVKKKAAPRKKKMTAQEKLDAIEAGEEVDEKPKPKPKKAPVKKVGAKKGKKASDSEDEEDSAVETDDSAPKKKKAAPKRKAAAKKAKSESDAEESGAESTPPKSKKAKKTKKEETDESDY